MNYQSNDNNENNKKDGYKKKRDNYDMKINLNDDNNDDNDNDDTGLNANRDKNTAEKKGQKKRRHYLMETVPAVNNWRNPYESNYESNTKFGLCSNSRHINSKKDISRLLHSFGFTIETEEKDKVKDMKKKLKGN